MSRRKLRSRDKSMDTHHIIPSSRGGGVRHNLVILPVEFHANWHKLFVNMTVDEVHAFIDIIMVPNCEWTYKQLDNIRRQIMGDK